MPDIIGVGTDLIVPTAVKPNSITDDMLVQKGGVLEAVEDIRISWNLINLCEVKDKTYDNNGTESTNSTFYTCAEISVEEGETYYAYSVYTHISSAYNHKVRKVNFYDSSSEFISSLDYVNTWVVPSGATSMSVVMSYIGNDYSNGRSTDDYITKYPVGDRYDRLSPEMRLSEGNVPSDFITYDNLTDSLKEKLDSSWNAINLGTTVENTFIRTDGTQVTSNSFYSVKDVAVAEGQVWYGHSEFNGSVRFVTFYDSSSAVVGGYEYVKSWTIPTNATSMSFTLIYIDGQKSTSDFVTTDLSGLIDLLNDGGADYGNMETRVATINFQFDDGDTNDSEIFQIFASNGLTCGFALISNISSARVPEYLMYQRNGFEILSHSTDSSGMSSSGLDQSAIDTKLKNSKSTLVGYGFNVRGWVTPYSEMNESYIHLARRYYDYATTVYYGEYDGTGTPYMTFGDDTMYVFRVSLQLTTLENQKLAVDNAISNGGFLTFYGHSADLDTTDYETTANLNSLLSYINAKVSTLRCRVLNPSDAVDYYFHVRHSDYLELLNG